MLLVYSFFLKSTGQWRWSSRASIVCPVLSQLGLLIVPLYCRIYVGSIYYEISEEDIKAVFQAFGQVKVGFLSLSLPTLRSSLVLREDMFQLPIA